MPAAGSSLMSQATNTFPCPHCGKAYPRLDKLVGRKVRCSQCRQSFQLQTDGSVSAIEDKGPAKPSGTPNRTETISPPAQRPVPATEPMAARQQPVSAPANRQTSASQSTRNNKRQPSEQAEKMRKNVSLRLQRAADKAASTVSNRREPSSDTHTGGGSEGARARLSTPQLSNEGRVAGRMRLLGWTLGLAALVLVFGLVQLGGGSDQRLAPLLQYTAPTLAERSPTPLRPYRQRAWLMRLADGRQPLVPANLGEVQVLSEQQLVLPSNCIPSNWRGLRSVERFAALIDPAKQAATQQLFNDQSRVRPMPAACQAAGLRFVPWSSIPTHLQKTVDDATLRGILLDLLLGSTDLAGSNQLRDRLLDGNLPAAVRLQELEGTGGSERIAQGQTMITRPLPQYRAWLLQLNGWDEPSRRLFDCFVGEQRPEPGQLPLAEHAAAFAKRDQARVQANKDRISEAE